MGSETGTTQAGRPLPRLEDEALLRGEGKFLDDLDPVANTRHPAILRAMPFPPPLAPAALVATAT